MQFVRESIFVSAIRSFFNTFLAVLGIMLALVIFMITTGLFSTPYQTDDELLEMKILPDAKGETAVLAETTPVILQLDILGIIGDSHITGDSIENFLRASRKGVMKKDRVKAILLNIDSPGGGAIDSDLIYQAIMRYKSAYNVPVYAYTPGLCASGGYMIACSADKIYASPSSIVGSVGAKWGLGFNFWQFMQTHGIESVTIAEGLYKEKYPSFTKPLDGTSSYADLIAIVADSYVQFTSLVAKARSEKGLTSALLKSTYGAQVYSGMSAEKNGYVDNGNAYYLDALTDLAKSANLSETPYQVVKFVYKQSPLQGLVSNKLALWMEDVQSKLLGTTSKGKLQNTLLYYYDPSDRL
jgi:signal peptide peptidase SppA